MKILTIIGIAVILGGFFFFMYSDVRSMNEWQLFRDKCPYGTEFRVFKCTPHDEYCRAEVMKILKGINDTRGSNQNNQDTVSRLIIEIYKLCMGTEK